MVCEKEKCNCFWKWDESKRGNIIFQTRTIIWKLECIELWDSLMTEWKSFELFIIDKNVHLHLQFFKHWNKNLPSLLERLPDLHYWVLSLVMEQEQFCLSLMYLIPLLNKTKFPMFQNKRNFSSVWQCDLRWIKFFFFTII